MNISEGNAGAKTFHNASTLKAEDRRERLTFLGLSMPAVLAILIVVFLPIFWLSSLSFYNAAGELSTENYARIFESALYRRTFVVTFQISIAVTVICILLGYPLCYLLTKVKDRTAAILMIFVLVPFWTSVLVRTYAWLVLLQRNGIINSSLMSLGIIEEPLQLAHNLTGSIIGMVHIMLPFLILPLYATMRNIDTDLVRAAVGLGSSPRGAFWRVFFPMSLPGLFAGIVLVFILSLGFFVTPALLGGGRVQMLAQRIESTITIYSNWGAASALGVVLLLLALVMIWLMNRVFGLDKLFMR
ncbi:ABC transporter permease [Oceanospirillaceae bacterium]|jgi:ABC-type spermidine/putrescine transport system permease subunit I|uniref:ABC transporter permease n=1 Tax=Candidatus Njordibacter sp. Uisw_058 TaxID=3230974 RepID=UPI001DEED8EA|nr:ABC transporter permease [Oceanospirillaceae bacterium]MBT6100303.1 ABC transporter permease [Oceanospirillaceae bacterium]MBT7674133.1 ABC transporter permease [Oceanospirillaceae bacterium]MDC0084888.1 ABC transporter permease [Oceanospirillaceae bacterium]MDC1352537.1 ABC transporter permease [Oceanospirillaceae bacterium]|tara:strand:+ start:2482 stop:3384 length:903 start_codon:yes stop_codon:yes gene_type:complete